MLTKRPAVESCWRVENLFICHFTMVLNNLVFPSSSCLAEKTNIIGGTTSEINTTFFFTKVFKRGKLNFICRLKTDFEAKMWKNLGSFEKAGKVKN